MLFTFGMLWFFIAVLPRSSIIPSSELICDYKTYLASVGWLFVLATALVFALDYAFTHIRILPQQFYSYYGRLSVMTGLMLFISLAAYQRNKAWESNISFWENIAKNAPRKARGHNNLGVALSERGRVDEAIEQYQQAIRLDAYYSDPFSNLSVAYSIKGKTDKAIMALNQAIRIHPYYPEAYNNRGSLFLHKKNFAAAERDLKIALQLRPYYGKAHYNLGRLHLEKKEDKYYNRQTNDIDMCKGIEGDKPLMTWRIIAHPRSHECFTKTTNGKYE